MEAWPYVLVGLSVILVVVCIFGLWCWRGIRLAQQKGGRYARTRWNWYIKAERKLRQRRVKRMREKGLAPPSVVLAIGKATHDQRARYEKQVMEERNRNNG